MARLGLSRAYSFLFRHKAWFLIKALIIRCTICDSKSLFHDKLNLSSNYSVLHDKLLLLARCLENLLFLCNKNPYENQRLHGKFNIFVLFLTLKRNYWYLSKVAWRIFTWFLQNSIQVLFNIVRATSTTLIERQLNSTVWTSITRFEILEYLYSNNIFKTREKYDRASKINLTYFMDETKPTYWVDDCFFGSFECSRLKLIIHEIINLDISWNKVNLGLKLSICIYV